MGFMDVRFFFTEYNNRKLFIKMIIYLSSKFNIFFLIKYCEIFKIDDILDNNR